MNERSRDASDSLRRLLKYAAGHRRRVLLATLCSVLNKLFDIAPEILIGVAVDTVVRKQDSALASLGVTDVKQQLLVLSGLTLLIWMCESLFEFCYGVLWRNLAQTVQHELRRDSYGHVQKLELAYFENRSSGGLVTILNDDINQLERFLDGGANALIQVATSTLLVGIVFFYLSPLIALFAMLPIPVILLGAFYYQRRAEPLYRAVREQASAIGARLSNNLAGIATIKSYVSEERELESLTADSLAYTVANARAIRVSSAFIPLIRMAILAGFVATLILGGFKTLEGTLAVGSFSVLVFLTQRLLWPLTNLAQTVDLYQRAMASTRRVLDLLETERRDDRGGGESLAKSAVRGELAFRDVGFAYEGRSAVLEGVSFTIPAGSTAAFVGTTGSGKSTVVKLLLRFYEPSSGEILLDGRRLAGIAVADLRRAIAFVSQDVFLIDGSVAENIAYGSGVTDRERIREAARLAEAEAFIDALPHGFDTQVGERGQKLSGGQRQRVSIARAILKDAPILILDEATSSVDNETEAAIQRSLERVAVGRTTLIVAHRLTTIRNADQVFTLENGRIVDRRARDAAAAG
ncbi:MAG TPA: ABC transporter ATP-binding protein [Polyangiaceae bacterium]|nr:ABC transporter ATP-binding protein [Polyangiaceae bacterium]